MLHPILMAGCMPLIMSRRGLADQNTEQRSTHERRFEQAFP